MQRHEAGITFTVGRDILFFQTVGAWYFENLLLARDRSILISTSLSTLHLKCIVFSSGLRALIISKVQKKTTKITQHPHFKTILFCPCGKMPDGAVTLRIDNPVVKLLCSLVKLLTLDLVVTCLQGGEHYALLPVLKIRVHQVLNEMDLRP